METEDLIQLVRDIDLTIFPCEYIDIRVENTIRTDISFKDRELLSCNIAPSLGVFIRIFDKGNWYYLSSTKVHQLKEEISTFLKKIQESPLTPKNNNYKPYNQNAYESIIRNFTESRVTSIAVQDKIELARSFFDDVTHEWTSTVVIRYTDTFKEKCFKSNQGALYYYDFNVCGFAVVVNLKKGDKQFDDVYTNCVSQFNDLKTCHDRVRQQFSKSLQFIEAPKIEPGFYPVVMEYGAVGIFAHESFGHKSESDFMLGDENVKETWKLGSKVGHEALSIVDESASDGTGYCPYDDEGFPKSKTYLIKNGILSGRLHNADTACEFDEKPTGNGRAMNFEFEPIVRMTNTYVEGGQNTFEELLQKANNGIYIETVSHGSGMSTFTMGPVRAYCIRDGKIADPVRISVLSGDVFTTLGLVEAASREVKFASLAFGGCGKGEQWPLFVGFGGSQIYVSKIMLS